MAGEKVEKTIALISELPPSTNIRAGTANLVKTYCSYHSHPFCCVVATDHFGANPLSGTWDDIPTLPLFRPRSLLPNLKIGLGLLDNTAFKLQTGRVSNFLKRNSAKRQFVMIANNVRFAKFIATLPKTMPRDIYIVDDFVADSQIYKVKENEAQKILDKLVLESDRIFTISPVYAEDLEKKYQRKCEFLPIPVMDSLLQKIQPSSIDNQNRAKEDEVIIHHSGQIHHLYADALSDFIKVLNRYSKENKLKILIEFWGKITRKDLEKSLGVDVSQFKRPNHLQIKLCGEVSPEELNQEQQRANFLLLANSFLPIYEKQVRCSFSSKICEYLVSGVPIILYTPPYSSLAVHLSNYQAAHVISEDKEEEVIESLGEIFSNLNKNNITVKNAKNMVQKFHSSEAFFKQLLTINEGTVPA